jgi:GNAT superfamily N-acetyltransferase
MTSNRAAEQVELEAARDLVSAATPDVGVELREAGEAIAVRLAKLPDVTELNRVIGLSSLEELDELEALYDGGRFAISLDPESGLDGSLAERGFVAGYPWQKFERGADPLEARTELSVEGPREAADFGAAFAGGFGLPHFMGAWSSRLIGRPGWHCFVAYDGDEPSGAGALFVSGSAGWLGLGATLPDKRGRGAQGAILAARINRAADLGLDLLVTETGVPREDGPGPSYRNILRAGFRKAYVRPNYMRP